MAKYTFEFKKEVIAEYLKHDKTTKEILDKYSIPTKSILLNWVRVYKTLGEDGLKRSRENKKYSFEFKKNMVELYLTNEISYFELASKFGINNPSIIAIWVRRYRAVGLEGLIELPKGRRVKMKKKSKKPEEKEVIRESVDAKELKVLQEENLKLRIENAYLKELRRLRLEEKSRKKEKQELSTVSEKNSD